MQPMGLLIKQDNLHLLFFLKFNFTRFVPFTEINECEWGRGGTCPK